MKLPTVYKTLMCALTMTLMPSLVPAQTVQSNVDQYKIIGEGNKALNEKIENQTVGQQKTAALQSAIVAKFNKMKQWENKYNSYLKTARGFAESLKAGSTIYAEGVQTLQQLYDLQRVIGAHPIGLPATLAMNDLYMETATEFIKVYTTIKESVAKGGSTNMLKGSERTEMLWQVSDQLEDLNKRLRQLTISIAYHNLRDVWNLYTAGLVEIDHATIANEALERWRRAGNTLSILEH